MSVSSTSLLLKVSGLLTAAGAFLFASGAPVQAGEYVNAYVSAPYTQSATDSGATAGAGYSSALVETFDESGYVVGTFTTETSTPTGGTFTSSSGSNAIDANGQYGGGLQGNYLGVNGTVTLTFSSPVLYLGLFWCAVDNGNSLTLYDQNNSLIGTYNAATFANLLPNNSTSTVTAIDGTQYNTINYFGRPTGVASTDPVIGNRSNNAQQYAYLNFFPGGTTAGGFATKIGKVVISETGATFESDNFAVLPTTTTPLSSFVPAGTVPEPATWVMILVSATSLVWSRFGRRRARSF